MSYEFDLLSDETRERLSNKGLIVEICLDNPENYIEVFPEIKNSNVQNGDFYWDLDKPCSREKGFVQNSLFLYMNTADKIGEYLAKHPEVTQDAAEGREIAKILAEAISQDADAAEETLTDLFSDQLDGIKDSDTAGYWLDGMLTNSRAWLGEASGWLADTRLDKLGDNLSHSLGKLGEMLEKDENAIPFAKAALQDLNLWLDEHKNTFGGETLFVNAVKKYFTNKYGAPEAVEAVGFYYPKYSGDTAIADEQPDENCDSVFLHHKNQPEDYSLLNMAKDHAAAINGEIGKVEIWEGDTLAYSEFFDVNQNVDEMVNEWLDEQEQKIIPTP